MTSVVTLYGMNELADDDSLNNLQVKWINPKQNIGIEIEVEIDGNTQLARQTLQNWVTKPDGSLRNGTEFVLVHPLRGEGLTQAIAEFFSENRISKSPTSGTHIHVDMRDKRSTLDVVKTMASIVDCIEPAIFGVFAPGREWCGYTNPLATMPEDGSFSVFSDSAVQTDFRRVFAPNSREYKYYGFNMLPLGRYGSVEFRYFNTAETAEELIDWVQFCMAVKQAAVSINTRSNFKHYLSSEIYWEEFLSKFFSQWRDSMLPFLPYNDVRMRWKRTRSRAATAPRMKTKMLRTPSADNKLASTRFKKFFAMKVKTADGKSKLVYDLNSVLENTPPRVFFRTDPCFDRGGLTRRHGDFLITDDILFMFDEQDNRWLETVGYRLGAQRVIDTYRNLNGTELARFNRAVAERLAVASPYPDAEVYALTDIANASRRSRLMAVAATVNSYYGVQPTEEEVRPSPADIDATSQAFTITDLREEYARIANVASTRGSDTSSF